MDGPSVEVSGWGVGGADGDVWDTQIAQRYCQKCQHKVTQFLGHRAATQRIKDQEEAETMATLYLQHLTSGDSGSNKAVNISEEELELLKTARGFPDETDPWGDEMSSAMDTLLREISDRPEVFTRPVDAHLLFY